MWVLEFILTFIVLYVSIRLIIYIFQYYTNRYYTRTINAREPFVHGIVRPHMRQARLHFDKQCSYADECRQRWLRKLSSYSIF
jgi:hypothetical protein